MQRIRNISIKLDRAIDLPKMDILGRVDCYVNVLVDEKPVAKSKTIWNNYNPVWNENFSFDIEDSAQELQFDLFDEDRFSEDDHIGRIVIPFDTLCINEKTQATYPVENSSFTSLGELNLWLIYYNDTGKLSVMVKDAIYLTAADIGGQSDPFVKLWLNDDLRTMQQTTVKKATLNPSWEELFEFSVPRLSKDSNDFLSAEVSDWDMFGKNDFLGETKIALAPLVDNSLLEYFLLSGKPKKLGSLVLTLQYTERHILPAATYLELEAQLMDPSLFFMNKLFELGGETTVMAAILKVLHVRGTAVSFLKMICEREIRATKDPATLFVNRSMSTEYVQQYHKLMALDVLKDLLKNPFKDIIGSSFSCVIHPKKANKEELANNLKHIEYFFQMIWDSIEHYASLVPSELRALYSHLVNVCIEVFPSFPASGFYAVANFVFSRFFVAAFHTPRYLQLIDSSIPEEIFRSIKFLGNCIQRLVKFHVEGDKLKISELKSFDLLIYNSYLPRLRTFLEAVSDLEYFDRVHGRSSVEVHYAKEMASISQYLLVNREKIAASGNIVANKLVAISKNIESRTLAYEDQMRQQS